MTYIDDVKRASTDCTVDYLNARIEALQKVIDELTEENKQLKKQIK